MKLRPVLAAGAAGTLVLAGTISPAFAANGQNVDDVDVVGPEALAQALVGENIEVTDVTYTGANRASGLFTGFEDSIGIDQGVVLTTGVADEGTIYYDPENPPADDMELDPGVLYGPNEDSSTSFNNNTDGDADLDALLPVDENGDSRETNDAAVLELTFIPEGDTVSFSYVFGSEEYPSFIGSQFNDIFAFFVNGENYATITGEDGVDVPVSINNVNSGKPYNDDDPGVNAQYFRENYIVDNTSPINTGLNGLTTVLEFEAPVEPGVENTLKLAIADVSDRIYDSAVMIRSGSFSSPVNEPPVADDIAVETEHDTAVDVTLSATDPEEEELTYTVDTDGLTGTLEGEGTDWVFTPEEGFSGETTFTYVANDGENDSAPATVTITVAEPANVAPVAEGQQVATTPDTALDISLTATDADGDELTYTVNDEGLTGTLEGEGADWTFTPEEGFTGYTTFTFEAHDGELDSNTATVVIFVNEQGEVENVAPVVENQDLETEFNTPLDITLTGEDLNNDNLTFSVDTEGLAGTLEGEGTDWTFTPEDGFTGETSFTYVANDGQLDSNTGTVTITVAEDPNVAPVADDKDVETAFNTAVDVTLTGSDEDGDDLTFEVVDQEELAGTLDGEGAELTFTPEDGFSGKTSFTYVANDGSLSSEPATVTITVAAEETPTPPETEDNGEETTPPEDPTPTPTETEQGNVDDQKSDDDDLPQTGSSILPLLVSGGALLAAGALIFMLRRRSAH